jgi:hypothetical protein
MNARDVFGIILRSTALWVFVWGGWQTVAAFAELPEAIESVLGQATKELQVGPLIIYGVPAMIAGLLTFRFAESILWFTFRK